MVHFYSAWHYFNTYLRNQWLLNKRLNKILFILILILGLQQGCTTPSLSPDLSDVPPVGQLYGTAKEKINSNNYIAAITDLEMLETRYPFSRYSEEVQLDLIYAYYRTGQATAAKSTASQFIRLYDDSEYLDYVYYLKGLTAFEQNKGWLDDYISIAKSKRDPGTMRDSFADFYTLIQRFPDSKYAPDARLRMVYLNNLLAEHEIHVARFYLDRQVYLGAINRAQYVLENFQLTPAVETALKILVETYRIMGHTESARNAQLILDKNFNS